MTISKRVLDVLEIMVEIARRSGVSTLDCTVDSGSHLKGTWRLIIENPATGEETVVTDLPEDPLPILVRDGYIERISAVTCRLLPTAFEVPGH